MVFDAQNGPQLVIRGISTALKMLNLPQKHPFFTFEAKKPLKQRVGAHFEHQKSFIYIKTWFFVLWLYSNSFNEGPTPYGIKRANLLCRLPTAKNTCQMLSNQFLTPLELLQT